MDDTDRDALIRTVIGEANGQGPMGEAAVAHVILNRTKTGKWGDSPTDVVFAKGQFEPWGNPGTRKQLLSISRDDPRYLDAARVVDRVVAGKIPDVTGGSTHFLNPAIMENERGGLPDWAKGKPLTVIGDHAFYAPEGRVNDSTPLAYTDGPRKASTPALDAIQQLTGGKMDMAALIQQMLAQQNKQPVTTGNNPFSRGFLGRAIGNLFNPQPDALPPAAAHVMAANQPDPYSPAPSQGGFDMSNAPMPTPRPADLGAPPDSAMQASTAPNPMMPAPTPTQDPLQAAAKDALAMPQAGGDVPNNLAFAMPGMDQKATGGLGPEMMNGKGDFGMVPPDPSAGGGFGGLFASLFGG